LDRTGHSRIKKQRDARSNEGWAEVRVWVPTKADAKKVQSFAAQLRTDAQKLEELKELNGIKSMPPEIYMQIREAIVQQGSAAYNTPSGSAQTLLSDLARDGYIADFANAFVLFARANPINATFIEESVPAKIMNHYWIRNQKLSADSVVLWQKKYPGWSEKLKAKLRNPVEFEITVKQMAEEIRTLTHH
jgi:hypothetical protein